MPKTENLTILFTDMVGFTERTAQQSRSQNRQMLKQLNRLLLPLVKCFRGKQIKSIGDSLLLAFRSPTDAVHCGMAMHDRLARHNRDLSESQALSIRVAVNLGEVRVEKGDLFGEAVNIAARVESLTPANQIYFTEAVYLAMNKAEVPSEALGEHQLKGIPEPVRLYRVPTGSIHRLVVADDSEAPGSDLPYGGVYLSQADAASWRHRFRQSPAARLPSQGLEQLKRRFGRWWWAPPLGLLLLVTVLTLTVHQLQLPMEAVEQPSVAASQPAANAEVEAAPAQASQKPTGPSPDELARRKAQAAEARELLAQGHQAYAQGLRGDGIGLYERALALDASLKEDPELIANLVESLGRVTKLSRPLMEKHPSPALMKALGERSGQAGPYGRAQATALLRDFGRPDLIDHVGQAIIALEDAEPCEDRLAAIKRLRQLGDPRALPHVEAQIETGFGGWMRSRCLRDYAKETVAELKAKAGK